jgi:hypothetical protein
MYSSLGTFEVQGLPLQTPRRIAELVGCHAQRDPNVKWHAKVGGCTSAQLSDRIDAKGSRIRSHATPPITRTVRALPGSLVT